MAIRKISFIIFAFLLALAGNSFGADISAATPDSALEKLKAGNSRYLSGKRLYPNQTSARRKATADKEQKSIAAVLSCSDSRVPPEHIFDMGIGDLYVIRDAGNVSGTVEIGSAEYAAEKLGTPLIVVMGHSDCSAVMAAVKGVPVDSSIAPMVELIKPAVEKAGTIYGKKFSQRLLDESIKLNVYQSIDDLLSHSTMIADLVKAGKVKVIGAVYHLDTGTVDWLGENPMQDEAIASSKSDSNVSAVETTATNSQAVTDISTVKTIIKAGVKQNVKPVKKEAAASKVPSTANQTQNAAIRFLFNKSGPLTTTPRKPLYVTLSIRSPEGGSRVSLHVYAVSARTGSKSLIFTLPQMRIIDGRAQTQFYWAAMKMGGAYLAKGAYFLYAESKIYNDSGALLFSGSHYAEPRKQFAVRVQ